MYVLHTEVSNACNVHRNLRVLENFIWKSRVGVDCGWLWGMSLC